MMLEEPYIAVVQTLVGGIEIFVAYREGGPWYTVGKHRIKYRTRALRKLGEVVFFSYGQLARFAGLDD